MLKSQTWIASAFWISTGWFRTDLWHVKPEQQRQYNILFSFERERWLKWHGSSILTVHPISPLYGPDCPASRPETAGMGGSAHREATADEAENNDRWMNLTMKKMTANMTDVPLVDLIFASSAANFVAIFSKNSYPNQYSHNWRLWHDILFLLFYTSGRCCHGALLHPKAQVAQSSDSSSIQLQSKLELNKTSAGWSRSWECGLMQVHRYSGLHLQHVERFTFSFWVSTCHWLTCLLAWQVMCLVFALLNLMNDLRHNHWPWRK